MPIIQILQNSLVYFLTRIFSLTYFETNTRYIMKYKNLDDAKKWKDANNENDVSKGKRGRTREKNHERKINNCKEWPHLCRGLINCLINLTDVKHVPCKDLSKPLSFIAPMLICGAAAVLASNGENPRDRLEFSVATQRLSELIKTGHQLPPSASHFFPARRSQRAWNWRKISSGCNDGAPSLSFLLS